jgi:heme A synthase
MTPDAAEAQALRQEHDLLRSELQGALAAINRSARRYRRLNTTFVLVAILSGGLVTLLGADAARGGTRVAQRVAASTTGSVPAPLGQGWKNVCGLMAILAFVGTVATGVNSGLRISERNTKAFTSAGILDGLLTELSLQSSAGRAALDSTRKELARVRREYPEYFR